MLIYLLLVFLALVAFHVITRYNRRGRLFSKMNGPTAYPIIGSMLMYNTSDMHLLWKLGRQTLLKYYPLLKIWGPHSALVCVCHPDDLEILLTSQKVIEKGYIYEYLQAWLKTGLLTSTDEKWRQRRRILTPAFHFGILKKYIEITCEQGDKFVEELKSEGEETVKSLMPFCSNYTLNIICESTMGVALDKLDNEKVNKYKEAVHTMGTIVLYRMNKPFIPNWLFPICRKMHRIQNEALKILHTFTDQVIQERREYHSSSKNKYLDEYSNNEDDTVYNDLAIGKKKRLAMLDLLLAAEKNGLINNEGIKEEVDTFAFEGHDTTAMAMTYTLMLLAENKEAQDRARDEVTKIFDQNNGKVGITEIQEFNYLERCIKESIRLYPPVATILRHTSEEIQLKHALIPADAHIMIHFWDTHRDSNFWSNPDKFDPDRFLPENAKNRHPFAYVPFSAGPRNCIGQKFALMELKSLVGRLLYDFYLEPIDRTENMRLMADLILRPLDPVHIKFIKVNKKINETQL